MNQWRRAGALALSLALALALWTPGARAAEREDSGLLWLVNYDHSVPQDYVPGDMQVAADGAKLRQRAAEAYQAMMTGLRAAGHPAVILASGYRSFELQTSLFTTRLAKRQGRGMSYQGAYDATRRYTAVPGTSEHQLGLGADLSTTGSLSSRFDESGAGRWIHENGWRYGFVPRYKAEKSDYTQIADEAWHFRYVGVPHAQIMTEQNWCLEEYIAYLQAHRVLGLDAGDGMVYEVFWAEDYPTARADTIDLSSDNAGGYITTTYHPVNALAGAAGHWSENALLHLFNKGALPWTGAVDPAAELTRGQFALLCAQLELPRRNETAGGFTDVGEDSPYHKAVSSLALAGVISHTGGLFYPDATLTREEAAVMMARALEEHKLAWLDYADVGEISGWAFQSVQQMSHYRIMEGQDGRFRPQAAVTWGEAAALLCKLENNLTAQ